MSSNAEGERQGLFSGLAFCADCGGKLHFGTCKSFRVIKTAIFAPIIKEFIKKIIVHAPEKQGTKRIQKIRMIFNFLDDLDMPEKRRRDLTITPPSAVLIAFSPCSSGVLQENQRLLNCGARRAALRPYSFSMV